MIPAGPRVVLISGASSGIGRTYARRAAERGDAVCLLARNADALSTLAGELPGLSLVLACDVTDADAVVRAVARANHEFGRIDALVHTAQVMAYGSVEDLPRAVFARVVDVAVHGTANLTRAVLPVMRAQKHGSIVVVNSLLGEVAVPDMGAYCTAKWAQLGLARTVQLELRGVQGVDLCVVSPGAVDTPIYDLAGNYTGRDVAPPPPVSSPEHVARAIERCLQRPRRHVQAGPANRIARLGYRLAPAVYARLVGPMTNLLVLRGPGPVSDDGNVFTSPASTGRSSGGWTRVGTRRRARLAPRRR